MLAIQVSSATCTGSIAYLSPLLTCMLRVLPEVWFDSKQTVVRLEADCGSTRSRLWFYSKQTVVLLEVRQPYGHPFVASRRSGGRRAVVRLPESGRMICPNDRLWLPIFGDYTYRVI